MNYKKNKLLAVLCAVCLLLTACGDEQAPVPPSDSPEPAQHHALEKLDSDEPEEEEAPDSTPGEELTEEPTDTAYPEELIRTWIHTDYTQNEAWDYQLTLNNDGTAEMPVQNGIKLLLLLYHGRWKVVDGDQLYLSMFAEVYDGENVPQGIELEIKGTYPFVLDNTLTFPEPGKIPPLAPNPNGEPLVFQPGEQVRAQRYLEDWCCSIVREYYEDVSQHAYPGYAEVDSIDDEGVHVHLYEDMGDHTATAGWYTIDPKTYQGRDDIMNTEIDFSPYVPSYMWPEE